MSRKIEKQMLADILANLTHLPDRTPGMAFDGTADKAFTQNLWHRFEISDHLKIMGITPQPSDHSLTVPAG